MSKRRPNLKDRARRQLRAMTQPGTVTIAELQHDDACPAWRTRRAIDCTCEPTIVLRPVAAPKKGGQP
jgi:hypothetical protein